MKTGTAIRGVARHAFGRMIEAGLSGVYSRTLKAVVAVIVGLCPMYAHSTNWDFLPINESYCADSYPAHANWKPWGKAPDPAWIVDINYKGRSDKGVVLRSPEAGTVEKVSELASSGWGLSIIWTNASGTEQFHLAHLDRFGKTGSVAAGDDIGTLGETGAKADGKTWPPHLHISRRVKDASGRFVPAAVVLSAVELKPAVNDIDGICLNDVGYVSKGQQPAKPNAPSGVTATPSGSSIALRWTDASSNESGFLIYRWNGSAWGTLTTVGTGSSSYTNYGLSSSTTYHYYVCSYNSAGQTCPSSYVSATTAAASSAPSSVSVNPASGRWASNQNLAVSSSSATRIYYKMVNTYNGTTPADPSAPSASNYDGYLSGPSATFALYGSSGQLKQTKLRFVGCNSRCGPVSGVYSYSVDLRPTKPAVPANQSASAASSSSITVRWSDSSNNESGFRVYRWSGSTWVSLATPGAGSTSYTNSGLAANTTYSYYVCSYNSAGESCPGTYVQAKTSGTTGSSWDGKNPSGTACEKDAKTVASRSNSYGTVELRWSNACKTNWSRVVPKSSSYSTYAKVRRTSDGRSYTTSGTGTRFTSMVYAPTVQSCASGTIKGYSISEVCR